MADGAIVHEAESDEISSRFLLVLALVAALGFSSHRLRPMVRSRGMAWAELISYAIGGVMVIAVFPMIFSMALTGANADGASRKQNVLRVNEAVQSILLGTAMILPKAITLM